MASGSLRFSLRFSLTNGMSAWGDPVTPGTPAPDRQGGLSAWLDGVEMIEERPMLEHEIIRRTPHRVEVRMQFPTGADTVVLVPTRQPGAVAEWDDAMQWAPLQVTDQRELEELLERKPLFLVTDDGLEPVGWASKKKPDPSTMPLDRVSWPLGQERPEWLGGEPFDRMLDIAGVSDAFAQMGVAFGVGLAQAMANLTAVLNDPVWQVPHVTSNPGSSLRWHSAIPAGKPMPAAPYTATAHVDYQTQTFQILQQLQDVTWQSGHRAANHDGPNRHERRREAKVKRTGNPMVGDDRERRRELKRQRGW